MLRWPAPEFDFSRKRLRRAALDRRAKWPTSARQSLPLHSPPLPARSRGEARRESNATGSCASPNAAAAIVKDGKKILVIDDTETLRDFVRRNVVREPIPHLQIVSAADGAEGLRTVRSACSQILILLDYSLPDFNGDEVCRRLLDDDATREIPVIMMSGHVAEMAETEARYENIVLTLSKPFVSGDLVEAVAKTLAKPPERRRRKTLPAAAKPDPPTPKLEHATNGHAAPAAPLPPESVTPPAPLATAPGPEPASPESQTSLVPVPEAQPAEPAPSAAALIPAHIAVASRDAVVLTIDLEVVSMQFSPALQITHLRAQPKSSVVLLHVDPRAISAVPIPEIAFEISLAQLNERGQLHTLHIVPALHKPLPLSHKTGVPVERLAILPGDGSSGLQLTPTGAAHLTVRLLAAFELTGVELSPTFSVSLFMLRARSGRMRVVLPAHGGRGGTIFEAAHVSLDPGGRIVELDLHIAPPLEMRPPSLQD